MVLKASMLMRFLILDSQDLLISMKQKSLLSNKVLLNSSSALNLESLNLG